MAEELRNYLDEKLDEYQRRLFTGGRAELPKNLPGEMKLFNVPRDFIKIFDRDLVAAGLAREVKDANGKTRIDKTNAEGCTLDIHCLRHVFATMLSQAGVTPRISQELLRHSDMRLTMSTYTHLQLVDTAGAVEALPRIPAQASAVNRQVRTGTDGDVWGAENGAEIGAERQEKRGDTRQRLTSQLDRAAKIDNPQAAVNTEHRNTQSGVRVR